MKTYLYRRGNGNKGNYVRVMVALADNQCPHAALCALVLNDFIPGKRVRRHIARTIETEGESEYGISATVYTGPDGETDFGAAYLTAELQPLSDADCEHYKGQRVAQFDSLRSAVDRGAWDYFRKENWHA